MDWSELRHGILSDPPEPGELVYLARTGSQFTWCVVIDPSQPPHATPGLPPPEAWLYRSWLRQFAADPDAFLAGLRAELESTTGGEDRYRWPLDP